MDDDEVCTFTLSFEEIKALLALMRKPLCELTGEEQDRLSDVRHYLDVALIERGY